MLANVVARWPRRPGRLFVRVAVALTGVSLVAPATATAAVSTKVTLGVAHILAAGIVIPWLARRD